MRSCQVKPNTDSSKLGVFQLSHAFHRKLPYTISEIKWSRLNLLLVQGHSPVILLLLSNSVSFGLQIRWYIFEFISIGSSCKWAFDATVKLNFGESFSVSLDWLAGPAGWIQTCWVLLDFVPFFFQFLALFFDLRMRWLPEIYGWAARARPRI